MHKSIAVIRHIGVEGLGVIEDVLKDKKLQYHYLDTWREPLPAHISNYNAIIILGGPMGVYEQDRYPFIKKELSLIEQAHSRHIPIIGICLGSQLIAQALGGKVYKGTTKEIGWYDIYLTKESSKDRLFSSLYNMDSTLKTIKVFQWHGDSFDLPPDAILLASSELYTHQAFKVNTTYGLQFHLEVKEADIKAWIDEYKTELNNLKTSIKVDKILEDTRKYINLLNKTSINVFNAFFELI